MASLGADAALDHLLFDPHAWARGPEGFLCRYSYSFGGRIVRNSLELGSGILLHEDTRLRASHEQSFLARLRFASTQAVLAQDAQGHRKFAYSRLIATAGGILACAALHPRHRRSEEFLAGMADSYLGHLQNSLLTEFSPDLLRFGRKVRLKILGQ